MRWNNDETQISQNTNVKLHKVVLLDCSGSMQGTKKTLASVANEEALVKLQTVKAERAKIEQAQLTPAMLRKMELETITQIYDKLSKSPNKVIIVGNPEKIILNN